MNPEDLAKEVKVEPEPGLMMRISSRLIVSLALMVLAGVGVLTVNVQTFAGDLLRLGRVVDQIEARLTDLERNGAITVNLRLDRAEQDIAELKAKVVK